MNIKINYITSKAQLKRLYDSNIFCALIYEDNIQAYMNEFEKIIEDKCVYLLGHKHANKILKLHRCKAVMVKENEVFFMFKNNNKLAYEYDFRWLSDVIDGYEIETDYNPFMNISDRIHKFIRRHKYLK